ncbi:MAG: hypothetical protein KJ040_08445 [Gammaproteobacteria bacterium]|nr:hypothetical protein [Gammaproteobacteria bacterium]
MSSISRCTAIIAATLLLLTSAHAAERDRRALPTSAAEFGEWSGFEGQEEQLGAAVAKTIREMAPEGSQQHDFTGREAELGQGVATVIRTLNVRKPYQHEMNDALVKLTLNYVQFAKDHDLMKEMVEEDVRSQMPMLMRTGKFIQQTGMKELALVAMTDRTACFYQLALEVKREPGKVSFKSPYGTVLAATRQLGMHDLTEKELHEIWTKPRFEQQAAVMGVNIEVSDWRDDGWVTLSIAPEKVAAR